MLYERIPMARKIKFDKELPKRMYCFFTTYDDERSAPSFSKFARQIGTTLQALEGLRSNKKFNEAWRECDEIRRDYLIDKALTKRFDASLVKFLLSSEGESESADERELCVKVTVEDE